MAKRRTGSCDKRRYTSGTVAAREAQRFGFEAYPCLRCGGWHLTSEGRGLKMSVLSPLEQAVLIVAREPGGAYLKDGGCYDGDGRLVCPEGPVRKLERKRIVRVERWGEIVPAR